jgi:hypothetical protein
MERDYSDDSRFTIERLDLVPKARLHGDRRRLVLRVMDAVFHTIDQRLYDLTLLIEKNKKDLRKCASRTERYKEIIQTYEEAFQKEDLTSVVKYYFALAKSDKLFTTQRDTFAGVNAASLREYDGYQEARYKDERRSLEEDVAWLNSYRTVP